MNTYEISDDGSTWDQQIEALNVESALKDARSMVTWEDYSCEGTSTTWITVRATNVLDYDDTESGTVTLDPPEPTCKDGQEHDWRAPYSVVGGSKDSPGVYGSGGGVIIQEVCVHCGCGKVTDTWAQRSDTGEQGLTSVKYAPGYLEGEGYSVVVDGKFVKIDQD